jgi:hypothetical protein
MLGLVYDLLALSMHRSSHAIATLVVCFNVIFVCLNSQGMLGLHYYLYTLII